MLDRYTFTAELRDFFAERGVNINDATLDELVDLFAERCRELLAAPPPGQPPRP